ncbi:DUF6293 family protein [Nitrosopumilus sp.]|uniref:HFX_2341 family transcriptional regulator domain-containing protein n=1 Tax=Nitrosopumilus sp. TaxID=2024843 RepID=UPI002931F68C|nr:DUF6293 family protein [Nitrosopumilus sp.]
MTKVLQIASFGPDYKGILKGIQEYPIHKLVLLYLKKDVKDLHKFERKIIDGLEINVATYEISMQNMVKSTIDKVNDILKKYEDYDQILFNVGAGVKLLGCALLSCAFIHGIPAFGVRADNDELVPLPIMKISYEEILSDAKLTILKALHESNGRVENYDELKKITGMGKPLLSYHILGNEDGKGLQTLGLVEVITKKGKSEVTLTTMGSLVVSQEKK